MTRASPTQIRRFPNLPACQLLSSLKHPRKQPRQPWARRKQQNWLQGLCSQLYKLHIRRGRPVAHLCVRRIDIQADQR